MTIDPIITIRELAVTLPGATRVFEQLGLDYSAAEAARCSMLAGPLVSNWTRWRVLWNRPGKPQPAANQWTGQVSRWAR